MIKEVSFEGVTGNINDQVDEAYKIKYSKSPYLPAMICNCAIDATVRIFPKEV